MNERKGILFVLATAVISGVSIYVNSIGVKFANPYVFTGLKNVIVALGLCAVVLCAKEWRDIIRLKGKDWLKLTLIGVIGGSVPFLLFFKGLSLTSAAKGGFIHKTMFLYVSFLAIVFLKEKINKSLLIGLAALVVGSILFLGIGPQALNWGDCLVFLATLMWAAEIVIAKRTLNTLSPRIVMWGRMFLGSVIIFGFLAVTGQAGSIFSYTAEHWKWIAIASAFLFGYVFTFYTGLKYVRASVATAVLALGAPITSVVTLIAQGTVSIHSLQWVGMAFMVAGVVSIVGIRRLRLLPSSQSYGARDH
ncbi:MAG: DMT family transporter [Patescibacteria group bacterium]|nr:DMT family transporter [Patescibacteria group bacterium]MDD5715203.1 DMT family transporter [Patescibacteria group bacterium]